MPDAKLFPGSVVTQSGFYLVSHSNGHRPDAETRLYQGLILPHCPECQVSYLLVTVVQNGKKKDSGQSLPAA